jgi:hypothetical protein
MSAKRPDPLDVMVGARIRIFRTDQSGANRRFAGNEATSLA